VPTYFAKGSATHGCKVGAKIAIIPQFWTANIQMLGKNCHDRVKPIIHSTKLQIANILPKFLR